MDDLQHVLGYHLTTEDGSLFVVAPGPDYAWPHRPLTEERLREIVREEIEHALAAREK